MKWLIAGLGSIGRRHLHNLLALGERDILLYRTHQSTLPDDELANFPTETDLESALAHQPDAVIIANPSALHLKVAIPVAKAGCHVLLEKPISDELTSEVDDLKLAVAEYSVRTLVGFQFRFHPVLAALKNLLSLGQIGQIYSFRIHWGEYLPGWHPWEDYRKSYAARQDLGGGVVNTLCHPLDYARWLFGEVSALSAVTAKVSNLEMDVEDLAEITLKMQNGCVGSIHLDYFQRPPAHWMEINGEKGHIRLDNGTGVGEVFYADSNTWKKIPPPEKFERNHLFLEEMRHFIDLCANGGESRCDLSEGIRALQLTEAVHRSAAKGCEITV